MLNKPNAHELAKIAKETGALVFRGQLQYPGPVHSASLRDADAKTVDWEIGSENIPDVLYELRARQMLLILAPVEGEPVHLCGICGFVLSKPGEPCPRCALINEHVATAIDRKRVTESVEDWLKGQRQPPAPHPLESELAKIQKAMDALEAWPPLWWADRILWRGLRWFYKMRQRRGNEAGENYASAIAVDAHACGTAPLLAVSESNDRGGNSEADTDQEIP